MDEGVEVLPVALPAPPKPASQSATMIAAAVTVVFSLLGAAGVVYTDSDVRQWTELAMMAAPMVATAGAGVVAWFGRRRANAPIEGGPADPRVILQRAVEGGR